MAAASGNDIGWPWWAAAWWPQASPQQPSVEDPQAHTQLRVQPTGAQGSNGQGCAVEPNIMAAKLIAKVRLRPFGHSQVRKQQAPTAGSEQLLSRPICQHGKQLVFCWLWCAWHVLWHKQQLVLVSCALQSDCTVQCC